MGFFSSLKEGRLKTSVQANLRRVLPLLQKVLFGFGKEFLDCGRNKNTQMSNLTA